MKFIQFITYNYKIYYAIFGTDNISISTDGIGEIRSTNVRKCIDCNCQITDKNDSGRECFVDGSHTQSICKVCDKKRSENLSNYKANMCENSEENELSLVSSEGYTKTCEELESLTRRVAKELKNKL